MKFGYWNLRGLGSAPLLLLKHVGADFEFEELIIDDPPYKCFDEWFARKGSLGFDFPNLPYLIDGDLKLTQSFAILHYLARKYGLTATADPDLAREDMLQFQLSDINQRLVATVYYHTYNTDEDLQKELVQLKTDLHTHLALLESFHPGNADWFMGSKLSYVDFFAYEMIDRTRELVDKDCLAKYPKLAAFTKAFEQLPKLKDYLASDEFKKAPIFGPYAKLGGTRR